MAGRLCRILLSSKRFLSMLQLRKCFWERPFSTRTSRERSMQSLEYTSTCTKTPGSKYGRENEGQHHTKSIHTGFTKPCTILLLRHTTNDCTLQTPVNHFYKSCFRLLCINWMPISGCIARNRVSFHHFPYTSSRTSSGSVLRPEHGTHPSPPSQQVRLEA